MSEFFKEYPTAFWEQVLADYHRQNAILICAASVEFKALWQSPGDRAALEELAEKFLKTQVWNGWRIGLDTLFNSWWAKFDDYRQIRKAFLKHLIELSR